MMHIRLGLVFFLFLIFGSDVFSAHKKREMRAVWIATVANIDWPTKKGDTEHQKKELVAMLDTLRACNFNAVVFQVRPTADAFYQSQLEPWSHYLTGTQGLEPTPFYDPLQFLIEEAHKRCIEVHAWINPYRVTNNFDTRILSKDHIYNKKPELFLKYGGKHYFNPGLQETRDYLTAVVMDIVLRYDVDAVHLDDYFYPYKVAGAEFPDLETFRRENRGINDRKEWRRDNVNLVVRQLQTAVKAAKPWVEFGVSPFGVWRNDYDDFRGSATTAGCTNYDELFADVLTWLENGWIDYITPQLYWEIGKPGVDFKTLAEWWGKYSYGKNYYVGLYASGMDVNKTEAWKKPNEVVRQMRHLQSDSISKGVFFYSVKYVLNNIQGLKDSLRNEFYKYPAIVPDNGAVEGGDADSPSRIKVSGSEITWREVRGKGGKAVAYYVIYAFRDGDEIDFAKPSNILCLTQDTKVDLSVYNLVGGYTFAVSSVNRFKKESEPSKQVWYAF